MKQNEYCPFCGERCISLDLIVEAGGVWYKAPVCPSCGATLRLERKMNTLRHIWNVFSFVFALFIIPNNIWLRNTFYKLPRSILYTLPIIFIGVFSCLLAVVAELDYEEDGKHPKPPTAYGHSFREKIRRSITYVQKELADRNNGIPGESTQTQLSNFVLPELLQLLEMESYNHLPPKDNRQLNSLKYAVMDWNWNAEKPSEIFKMLKELDLEYKNQ